MDGGHKCTEQEGKRVLKPWAILDYNEGMKGFDISDPVGALYLTTQKRLKW